MRMFIISAVGLATLAVFAPPAYSATKLVPEEGAIEIILLRQDAVRQDLQLTAEEAKKIDEFCDTQWTKAQEISELNESERDKTFAEMTKENERFISETLTKEQRKRLDEIMLQVAGLLWVTRPEVASRLELTAEQKKKAETMQQIARDETEQLLHATKDEQKDAKLRELRQTSRERLMSLLTDSQKTKWRQMTGQPLRGELQFAARKGKTLR